MKINPCPFCGEQKRIEARDEVSWNVHCQSCGATGPSAPGDKRLAIERWNERRLKR